MAHYIIIGGDQKEYGPISADDIRQWISEGRLNLQSLAKGEGDTAWRTLGSFPEFADTFKNPPTIAPSTKNFSSGTADSSVNFLERDYEIDLGGCISRGWDLVKNNMSVFLVGPLIYLLIEGAAGMLSSIPFLGIIIRIANFVVAGPFMGGIFYLFIRGLRGEPAEIGDIFSGFKRAFGQLFLVTLVSSLLVGLCMLPFIIIFAFKFIALGLHPTAQTFQNDPAAAQQFLRSIFSLLLATLPVLLIGALPATYLTVSWKFALPLVLDKQMDFWTAMKTSWKMVNKHWWQVFGLVVLVGLLNVGGVLLCCVGFIFTFPIGLAALMSAYETIFGERKN